MMLKKAKRLLAMLLSLLVFMGALPMSTLAETLNEGDTVVDDAYHQLLDKAVSVYYTDLMACENYEEMLVVMDNRSWDQFQVFIAALVDEDEAALLENMDMLFNDFVERTKWPLMVRPVNFTKVADFMPPVKGQSAVYSRSISTMDEPEDEIEEEGLILDKRVELINAKTQEYKLTLEAYATGATTIIKTEKPKPVDVIFVLDQSGSMVNCIRCGNATTSNNGVCYTVQEATKVYQSDLKTDGTYYRLVGNEYQRVYYCNNNNHKAWYTNNHYYYGQHYNNNTGTKLTPKTSENSSGTQFYEVKTTTYAHDSRRIDALEAAVQSFADSVTAKAIGDDNTIGTSDDVNHRIAIVGFASDNYDSSYYYTNSELLSVPNANGTSNREVNYNDLNDNSTEYTSALQSMNTASGKLVVDAAIDDLEAMGATCIDLGMQMAEKVFDANPINEGEERSRVVIVFTDGEPSRFSSYDTDGGEDVADGAIYSANNLKTTYGATVYAVGVFAGADGSKPSPLPANDEANRANRIMHLISSNYSDATSIKDTSVTLNKETGYYLSASDTSALNNIFQMITNKFPDGGASVTLDDKTVIKDVLTEQFILPDGADISKIKVFTENYIEDEVNNTGKFDGIRVPYTGEGEAAITISDNTVSVSNFDFAKNYVGVDTAEDGTKTYRGQKLIIEIPIKVKPGFIGGNDVITNAEGSAVYENATATTPVDEFDSPMVNVPISDQEIAVADHNVYLLDEPTMEQLLTGSTIQMLDVYGQPVKDENGNVITDPAQLTWQNAYVEVELNKESGVTAGLTADSSYTATLTITPEKATGDIGEEAVAPDPATATGNINVFMPIFTFQDTDEKFFDTLKEEVFDSTIEIVDGEYEDAYYPKNNYWANATPQWRHTKTNEDGTTTVTYLTQGVSMLIKDPPTTILTYDDAGVDWLDASRKVISEKDIPVNVTVKIGDTDVTDYSYSTRVSCNCTLDPDKPCDPATYVKEAVSMGNKPEFIVHIYDVNGDLAITKKVGVAQEGTDEPDFVNKESIPDFVDDLFDFTITMTAAASKTYSFKMTAGTALNEGTDTPKYPAREGTISFDGNGIGMEKLSDGELIPIAIADGQTITIKELPPHAAYTVVETVPAGYVNGNYEQEGKIVPGYTQLHNFTNIYTPSTLTIKKEIIGEQDANCDKHVFAFTVKFDTAGDYYVNGSEKATSFEAGVAQPFPVTGEGTLTIAGLPIGIGYTVAEVVDDNKKPVIVEKLEDYQKPVGYEFKQVTTSLDKELKGTSTNPTATGTIAEVTLLTYTNEYKTGNLVIDKVIVDNQGNAITNANIAKNVEDDEFKVNVTLTTSGTYTVKGKPETFVAGVAKQFTITDTNGITIMGIPRDATYTVTEVESDLPAGYRLSHYNSDVDNKNSATGTMVDGNCYATITNIYETGDLKISKEVVGKYIADDTFEFIVTLPAGEFVYTIFDEDGYEQSPEDDGKIKTDDRIVLKDGWHAIIYDIPAGTKATYSVAEDVEDTLGVYNVTSSGESGVIIADDPNTADVVEMAEAKFTNTHRTENLIISKTVDDETNVSSEEEFRFLFAVSYSGDFVTRSFKTVYVKDNVRTDGEISLATGSTTLVIANGAYLQINGLPVGARCTVTEILPDNYTVNSEVITVTISEDNPDTAVVETNRADFINIRALSSLTIEKTVNDAYGNPITDDNELAEKDFNITVKLSNPDKVTLESRYLYQIINTDGNVVPDADENENRYLELANGEGIIALRHGQSAVFETLPALTRYEVTEIQYEDFEYNVTYLPKTGTTKANSNRTATITNQLKFGNLAIGKTVDSAVKDEKTGEKYDIPEYVDHNFTFTVILKDENGDPLKNPATGGYTYSKSAGTEAPPESGLTLTLNEHGVGTITLAAGQVATIANLPPKATYTVTEATPVGYDMEGKTEVFNGTKDTIDAGKTDTITFLNVYKPAALKIQKVIEGDDVNSTDDVFTFDVTFSEGGYFPVECSDSTKVESAAINGGYFNAADNGTYTIEITGENWISLQSVPLNATYIVTEKSLQNGYSFGNVKVDGVTYAGVPVEGSESMTINGAFSDDNQTDTVVFTNTYTTGNLTINKTIINADNNTGDDVFYVNISGIPAGTYKVNGSNLTFDGGVKRLHITSGQGITIEGIPIDTVYTVTEDTDTLPVGYDASAVYYDNDTANKTGSTGTIVKAGNTATVTNTYNAGDLKITKTVIGKFVVGDSFNFTVKIPDGTYTYTVSGMEGDKTLVVSGGSGTIDLQDGQTATIKSVPLGAAYEVVENLTEAQAIDYVTSWNYKTGNIIADVSATTDVVEVAHAQCTNTHKLGNLQITKTVSTGVSTTEKFEFTVTVNYNGELLAVDGIYGDATFTEGVAKIELAHNESATITGLPAGATYSVVETVPAHYQPNTGNSKKTGTIAADATQTAAFTNTHKLSEMTISKTVTPVSGYSLDDTEGQATKLFTFTIDLDASAGVTLGSSYPYTKGTETGNLALDSNGVGSVTLKHGESITIKNLPVGTAYKVIETPDAAYATTVSQNGTAAVAETTAGTTGMIDTDGETLAYNNAHKPGTLKITKVITLADDVAVVADDPLASIPNEVTKEFVFTVTLKDAAENELPTSRTFEWYLNGTKQSIKIYSGMKLTLHHGDEVIIEGLLPGTRYEITETPVDGYVIESTISDECTPETEGVIDAGKTDTVAYVNMYNPEVLVIRKVITGSPDSNVANDIFTFELTLPKSTTPYILTDQNNNNRELLFSDANPSHPVTVVGAGSVAISGIPIGYEYTVREISMPNGYIFKYAVPYVFNAENKSWRYDGSATISGQTVTSEIAYLGNEVEFTNDYTTGELEISKQIVGLDAPMKDGQYTDSFKFTVNFYTDSTKTKTQEGTFEYVIKDADGTTSKPFECTSPCELYLKDDQTATFTGMPTETYYTVTEARDPDYTTTSTGENGTITTTKSEAKFTNSYGYGSLTIDKNFAEGTTPDAGETFLFYVTGPNNFRTEVVIEGDGSVTLTNLPVGTYKVWEDTTWSWRYETVDGVVEKSAEVKPDNSPTVVFTNKLTNDKWISDVDVEDNAFIGLPR